MDSNNLNNVNEKKTSVSSNVLPAHSDVTEVDVTPIYSDEDDYPVIPPDRRLSWLGWGVAIAVFIINKKIGMVFFILLLVFGKFPTLNLRNLPGTAGRLFRKMRS